MRTGLLIPSAPIRRRAAILEGMRLVGSGEDRERTGHEDRFRLSGSSSPFSIEATVVLENRQSSPPLLSSDMRASSPRVRFAFSVIVAIRRRGALYRSASAFQSNWIRESFAPSQTCISSYGWTRFWSTCFHAPMSSRNSTEDGVRLLARLEYPSSGGLHC